MAGKTTQRYDVWASHTMAYLGEYCAVSEVNAAKKAAAEFYVCSDEVLIVTAVDERESATRTATAVPPWTWNPDAGSRGEAAEGLREYSMPLDPPGFDWHHRCRRGPKTWTVDEKPARR